MGLDEKFDAKSTEAGGKVKKTTGEVTDNDSLKNEGRADEAKGGAQGALENAKDAAGDAKDSIKNALK